MKPVGWPSEFLYREPVTAPVCLMYDHGVLIMPPSHPLNDEQKHTSCAESGKSIDALVAMHMRSDAASAPANAQQQPQLPADTRAHPTERERDKWREKDAGGSVLRWRVQGFERLCWHLDWSLIIPMVWAH